MKNSYSEEQEMLRASAREFLEKECPESTVQQIETSGLGYSPDLWRKIADLGWLGLIYPEQYGGSDMGVGDLAVLFEEMGRAMFPSPFLSSVILGGLSLLKAGSEKQKSAVLPGLLSGETIIAVAMNEPKSGHEGAGWSSDDVTVRAEKVGDFYVLNGSELFVQGADTADIFLVPARTGEKAEDISLFLVNPEDPGVVITRLTTITGDNQCEVIFNNVDVPDNDMVGSPGAGWAPLSETIQAGSVLLAAQMLGAGERLLEMHREDLESRARFGKPGEAELYDKEYMDNLADFVSGCRQATYTAAEKLAAGEPCDFELTVVNSWRDFARRSSH